MTAHRRLDPFATAVLGSTLLLTGFGSLAATTGAAASAPAVAAPTVAMQPRTDAPASTLAVVKVITDTITSPMGVAVDDGDDSVYVVNYVYQNAPANSVSVINGRTGTVGLPITGAPVANAYLVAVNDMDDTVYLVRYDDNRVGVVNGRGTDDSVAIPVGNSPIDIAVDQGDDTVYVANSSSNNVTVINGRDINDRTTIPAGIQPFGVSVNNADDTVYVANYSASATSIISGATRSLYDTVAVGAGPWAMAVNQTDDTVYVANSDSDTVSVINGRTGQRTDDTIASGDFPRGVAVNQIDNTIYIANQYGHSVTVVNGSNRDDSVTLAAGFNPQRVAIDQSGPNSGLAYVTAYGVTATSGTVSVIGRVTPSLSSHAGSAGDSVTITVDAPQVDYDVDDSTIESVSFGDDTAAGLTPGTADTWTATVPAGSGTVPVTVTFKGGLSASAGTYTYSAAPTPAPVPDPTPVAPPGGEQVIVPPGVTSVDFPAASTSLGAPTLTFDASSGPVTAIVQPVTNPTAPSATPFLVGQATFVDITVVGASGPVEICINGDAHESMWHFDGQAWVDVTTRHTDGRVCGTVTSFSPFAVAPAKKIITFTANGKPTLQGTKARLTCTAPSFTYTQNGQVIAGSPTYNYTLSGARGTLATKWSRSGTVKFTSATKNARWVRCTVTATQAGTSTTSNPSEPLKL